MESDLKKKILPAENKIFLTFLENVTLSYIVYDIEFNSKHSKKEKDKRKSLEERPVGPECEEEPNCIVTADFPGTQICDVLQSA